MFSLFSFSQGSFLGCKGSESKSTAQYLENCSHDIFFWNYCFRPKSKFFDNSLRGNQTFYKKKSLPKLNRRKEWKMIAPIQCKMLLYLQIWFICFSSKNFNKYTDYGIYAFHYPIFLSSGHIWENLFFVSIPQFAKPIRPCIWHCFQINHLLGWREVFSSYSLSNWYKYNKAALTV